MPDIQFTPTNGNGVIYVRSAKDIPSNPDPSAVYMIWDGVDYRNAVRYETSSGKSKPSLTQPVNSKLAIYGDSRTAQNSSDVSGVENYGYAFWARLLSRQRVSYSHAYNFGVGGDTTTQMLARLQSVLDSDAGVVVMLGSTNDRTASNPTMSAADSIANLDAMISALVADGKFVIIVAETPRGDSVNTDKALTGTALQEHFAVRNWILQQQGRAGVKVADAWPDIADRASTTGYAKTGMFHDGLHPNASGAYYIGKAVSACITELYPVSPIILQASNTDVYSAANPYGCISANPMLDGTAGTPGSGGSGNMATGYTGANSATASAMTRVYSKTAEGFQQVVIGGGAASGIAPSLDLLRQIGLHTSLTAGKKVQAVAEIDVSAGASNIMSVQLGFQVTNADTSTTYLWDGDRYSGTSVIPAVAFSGILRTQEFTIPAGITDFRLRLVAYGVDSAAASGTVIIKSLSLRYVD